MSANLDLHRVNEWQGTRGFSNLFNKESRGWWGTRRWWINALLWMVILGGITAIMLFAPSEEANEASAAEIASAGGLISFIVATGLSAFFEFGGSMLAIGTVILAQDLIIGERQSGVAEWLLSKPVARRAYVLAKVAVHAPALLILLVGLPSATVYAMLSVRTGALYPVLPFLPAVGIISLNILFYLTFTLMLGTIFNNRGPILGIALGSVLGGSLLASFIQPLATVTPWMMPKLAWLTATGQALPAEIGPAPLVATALWCITFIFVALTRLEKMEF